jgi:predicted DNA-binding transcriptional regulator YafY
MQPRRRDSLDTALLLVELLKRIPRQRKITAGELQQQLASEGMARDIRSIQRHLDTLSEHFDIERDDRAKPYGYRWKERAQGIALPTLTPQESLMLRLAHDQLRSLLPPALMRSMQGFFEQAERTLGPGSTARRERAWLRKVRVVATSQPLLAPELLPGVFETVTQALYEEVLLEVEYHNAAGRTLAASVMPLGLAQQGARMYLVCRFEGYDNERILALHRIRKARATTLHFRYPKDFDLARFDEDGRFGFGQGDRIRLSFRIDRQAGQHLTETPLSADQEIIEEPDGYFVRATLMESMFLDRWLRGFGDEVWDVVKQRPATPDSDPAGPDKPSELRPTP